jgi:hypothetical protein
VLTFTENKYSKEQRANIKQTPLFQGIEQIENPEKRGAPHHRPR